MPDPCHGALLQKQHRRDDAVISFQAPRSKEPIAVAVSGGVDSLVAAFLLKKKYSELFGIHFVTGYELRPLDISSFQRQLGIPIHRVDLRGAFENEVVRYFIETYCNGKTPNPCLICNPKIKFGALMDAAKKLGAATLATGHYAEVKIDDAGTPHLFKGRDPVKEQSYFLARLNPEQLSHALFPLSAMKKEAVIALAKQEGLVPCEKKESQDICFIPRGSFADFIVSKCDTSFPPGDIVTPDMTVIGTHKGLHRYTVGQRRGLNCPGPAPYYVKSIEMKTNRLVVSFKEGLYQNSLTVSDVNWLSAPWKKKEQPLKVVTKIRYSHAGATSWISPVSSSRSRLTVQFDVPQSAVTPGQGAVFYDEDQVVGSGIIQ